MGIENKKKLTFFAILFLCVLTVFLFGRQLFSSLPIGFTTLSLSQANFINNCPGGIPSPCWIMYVAQGGLGQHAEGIIDNDRVGALSGTKPQYDLTIKMDWNKLAWEYPIRVSYTSTPVKTYTLITWDDWRLVCFPSDFEAKCGKAGIDYIVYGQWSNFPWPSVTCFCIKEKQETSFMGYLGSCDVHSISTITVEAGGKTYYATIDTKGEISKKIGDYTYVIWSGNLMKHNCKETTPYIPYYRGGWKLGDANYYNNYIHYYRDLQEYIAESVMKDKSDRATLTTKINYVNNYANLFLNTPTYFGEIVDASSVDRAYVELAVSSDVQVPTYTFYVSASWLGIYQPQPVPKIIEVRGVSFKSGEYGLLYVKWQNVGDSGNFEVWAECVAPFYILESTKTVSVLKDSYGEAYIKIGANTAETVTKSCVIKVKGAGTNVIDSRTVSVTAGPQTFCNPGQKACSVDLRRIEMCNQQGSGWVIYQECGKDERCSYKGGEPVCVKETSSGGGVSCVPEGGSCGVGHPPCCEGLYCDALFGLAGKCVRPQPQIPWEYILPTLLAVLSFLLIYIMFREAGKGLAVAIAVIVALLVWFIVYWIVRNWLLVLLVSLGGLAIYLLFALGIVTVATPLLVIGGKKK